MWIVYAIHQFVLASDGLRDYIYFQTTQAGRSGQVQVESATSDDDIGPIGPGDDQPHAASARRKRPLTGAENRMVDEALNQSLDSIVAKGFNIEIRPKDLKTLESNNYLNDEIINFYFGMIVRRSANVYAFNTFFMGYLLEGEGRTRRYNYNRVSRWSKHFDPFELDKLFVPIHLPLHWTFIIIHFQTKAIHYYDSLHCNGARFTTSMLRWLEDEAEKREKPFDRKDWKLEDIKNSPSQGGNTTCCGVFAVMSADYLSADIPLSVDSFGLKDMPSFRRYIARDILRGYLDHDDPSELSGNDNQGTSICLLYI